MKFSSMGLWSAGLSLLAFLVQDAHGRDKSAGPGSHTLTIAVDGLERTCLVHVPARYKPQTPSAVVIMLHGGGGTGRAALWETGWADKSEKEGFLAIFPNAMARDPARPSHFSRNPQLWNDGSGRFYPGQKAPDDVRFIAALLDDLSARYSVDKSRIFVTGFSNGASMGFRVGAELSQRIAAIAPVAGALWLDVPAVRPPVSLCYITGTADPLNLIEGGVPKLATGASDKIRAKPKPPVRDSILKWAGAIGCPALPATTAEANGVRTETYSSGQGGAEVVYIAVEGLGHTWAGGKSLLPEIMVGQTSDKISATDVIWAFFQKHAKSSEAKKASAQAGLKDAGQPHS
ncbi:MAG: dienelactone hydrolase family protein [Lacunisphaera sp.]|nr:dienelactone hydrolase family protein [Lacunisphaera sp.]